ncbi:MAG TPA: hypothetical protein VD969_05345 [Symbiobacteriaceae bacterium]|nr:hypothetical protein [Symbiobacteriaceae bacterium]
MNKNQPIPTEDVESEQPEDPRWYLQRMYEMAVEPIEGADSVAIQAVK